MDRAEQPVDVLWEDGERLYCRIWRDMDDGSRREFLVAQPCAEHPTPGTISSLAHEYDLREHFDPAWALRPLELLRDRGQTMLVFEPTTARPLDTMIAEGLPVGTFLRVAIAVTEAVGRLHQCGLIHKDINATNILIDPETGNARLAGFGLASRLPRERPTLEPPDHIAGTLSHMAPEQTGRMNRSVDSRSDLYSLGVTLYQALTGSLPFTASEPMAWVHCHIARKPAPLDAAREDIPPQIADIVMKLLAKTPEERYQTAAGVERDLRRCLEDWEQRGAIVEFAVGEHDPCDRLFITEKLYGRADEIETLLAAFDAVVATGKPRLVLVSGYSGIGKSSVVGELQKVLVPSRGLFTSGKFDQLKRDVPYATLAQAFQSLIRQLLAKPDAELAQWREQLSRALSPNGALLLDLIPELKFVIGEQPPVPDMPSSDAKARFQMTIRRLVGVFAHGEHPLALFLDDLQWLDNATLDLVEDLLVQAEPQHLFLVGAYRDNEVDAVHPLMRTLTAIRASGAVVEHIVLGPLDGDALTEWIAEALHRPVEAAQPLAQLVREKTAGNPFFVNQFLRELAAEDLIVFEPGDGRWRWDLDAIRSRRYTDNVVDFMVARLSRLPLITKEALKGLACLGNRAKTSTLARVQEMPEEQLHSDLWEALRLELIVHSGDSYRFVHDRVQEAAYSLVPEEQRAPAHLRIGRLLATQIEGEHGDEAVFEIVGHFNRAIAILASEEERDHVAALNLAAGKRAKKAAAVAPALTYLAAGSALMAGDGWHRRHDLMFELERHRAECEFLNGEIASADQRLMMLLSRAATVPERCAVACLVADVSWPLQQPDRGLAECLDCLRYAGLDIPRDSTKAQARAAYDQICSKLDGVGIDELVSLPLLTDPTSRAILEVVAKAAVTTIVTDLNLGTLLICAAVDLGLRRGHCDSSCFAYEFLGYIAAWHFDDFEAGVRFGRLGLELVARKGLRGFESTICNIFSAALMPWATHIASCRPLLRTAFELAKTNGDRHAALHSCCELISNHLWAGDSLVEAERESEAGLEFCRKTANRSYIDRADALAAFIRNLRGLTPQFGSLDDGRFNELLLQRHFESEPHLVGFDFSYSVTRLQARFLAGDYAAALDASVHAETVLSESVRRNQVCAADGLRVEGAFYGALAHAAACDDAVNDIRREHVDTVAAHLRELELWARHCPENFENRAALVAAELARIEGRDRDAAQLYEDAIRTARKHGFVHHEALALELAARFYTARGFDRIAKAYLRDARSRYREWGADGKVQQLETQYPYLADDHPSSHSTRTVLTPAAQLDLSTVLKLSQAVQGETDVETLIAAVMRLGLEHAGAERGLLILPHGEGYRIEAEAASTNERVTVDLKQTSVGNGDLPPSVLQYVLRTRERVLLHDAGTSEFADDEYLRRRHARSVLCIPLLKQTRLTGILYLENNLTSGAFTPARMALLEVLASEAAVSLESARLYHDLREREREFRLLVDSIPALVWRGSPAGELEYLNERAIEFLGRTLESLTGGRWLELVYPEDRDGTAQRWRHSATTGASYDDIYRLRRADGEYRWIQSIGEPFYDGDGRIVHWYGSIIDIDDRKRAEAELGALKDQLYKENLVLRDEVDRASMFEEIVGASKTLKAVLSRIAKVAPTDSTVFISGETGTGKELIARAVHRRSQRAGRAFVSVNCAALAPTLISSELFGHEKGAFTGATQRRLGRFELADGGTIFLDEVGELLPDTQVMLLRVLQEREFERVGGTQPLHVDVRVIAATNRDLKAAIAAGSFRQDLYYRLNVFPIEVPPLRERKDDLLILIEYFVQRYASRAGKPIHSIDKKTLDLLHAYDWPGNIRELQNVIERSVILSSGGVFIVDELWLSTHSSQTTPRARTSTAVPIDPRSEREIIEAALAESRGRIAGPSGAAARLNIPASTLEYKIKSLNIRKSQFKFAGSRDDR